MSTTNKEFFENLSNEILKINSSFRWVATADFDGNLINVTRREGLDPLMTLEENQEYTINSITRHKLRSKFQNKLGKLIYALGKYEKLTRIIVPINDKYYVLLTIDVKESHIDSIMTKQVIPTIKNKIHIFE